MNKFIDWSDIDLKGKTSGTKKMLCPSCSESRKKKNDPCLYVNINSGVAKCYNCEALSFRESEKAKISPSYTLPAQDWANHTNLSKKLVKWLENERGIHQSTLINLGITEEAKFQPKLNKEVNNVVFNYFEGDTLVNKKYRSGNKAFTQSAGGKPILYNINSIIGASECYIVEGEFDVLALYDFGVRNVVSVPNGANDNDDYWINSEPYLKDVEKFIIAVDNDEKGIALKDKIAQRLGRWRCEFIEWSGKDANEALLNDTMKYDLANRKRFPISGTFKVSELYGDIVDLFENGLPETIYPKNKCFGNLKDFFSLMMGHLVTVTGIPSHGKSNFSEWHVLNLVNDYNFKASFFSPEHSPMALHQTNFIQKAIGKNFWSDQGGRGRITKEDIERYRDWANEKLYFTAPEKGEVANWDWLLDKFKEQMLVYGINIFVIDAFNKVLLPKGNKKDMIDEVLTRLTSFCQSNNVLVFLVAHPTKMKLNENGVYDMPTLYDVSGSADFRNQTHDGYGIYRYFENEIQEGYTTFTNLKTKFNFQGDIGKEISFDYDRPTGRYYVKGSQPPLFDMTKAEEEQVVIEPNIDFDDEIPF